MTLRAPAPETLAPAPTRRTLPAGRRIGLSLLVHLAVLAAIALIGGRGEVPVQVLPVELVPPEDLDRRIAEAALTRLPPLTLPTTLSGIGEMRAPGLDAIAERWPEVPVRIRPPRLTARTTTQLRAPDLPPPMPMLEGYDLESSLRKADADPATVLTPARTHPDNPPPLYPDAARRLGLQGEAVVRVTVTEEGRVDAVLLVESSGWTMLDDAALESVRTWRFEPARRGDEAVRATIEVPIVFRQEQG